MIYYSKLLILIIILISCSDDEYITNNYKTPNNFKINVTASDNGDYVLSGNDRNGKFIGKDPSLTFKVGDEIIFNVSATGHPFYLKTKKGIGTDNLIRFVINNGADINTIKEILGHSSLSSTQIYTKIKLPKIVKDYNKSHPRELG